MPVAPEIFFLTARDHARRPSWPAFPARVTACVAPRRSIRQERAEKRSGDYGRGPRRSGRAPGRDPDSAAQAVTLVRNAG